MTNMVKDKKNIGSLALSVLKFELMGKFFAVAITISVLGIASAIHKSGFVFNQILVCLAYFPSFYGVLWKAGSRSDVVDSRDDKWKGLKVGLLASVPYFLSTLALVIIKVLQADISILWYRILNVQYLSIFNTLFPSTNNLSEIGWMSILICFALQLILPLVTQISYTLGRHHFSVSEHIMYKNVSNKRK